MLDALALRWAQGTDGHLVAALGTGALASTHPQLSRGVAAASRHANQAAMREAIWCIRYGKEPQTKDGQRRYQEIVVLPLWRLATIKALAHPWVVVWSTMALKVLAALGWCR